MERRELHSLPPGFIDIHCHLIHGVDDGPKTLDVSAQMCQVAQAAGTVAVVSTPHASHRFAFDPLETSARRAELEKRLPQPLRLFGGCEVEVSLETLPAALSHPQRYTLNASRYLLLELMPGGMPPNLERIFTGVLDRGLVPVIAHPERNAQLQRNPERLLRWVERGCLVQLTGDSLTGRMGRRAHAATLEMLRLRVVHFVASDGHDPIRRPPRLIEAYRVIQRLSPDVADVLFIHHPRAVLEDRPLRGFPAF